MSRRGMTHFGCGSAAAVILLRGMAALLVVLLALPASGAETGTLRGTVRDGPAQGPLEGVLVSVEGPAMPVARTRISDARGSYWFPVLPPGEYRITFSKEGYQNRAFDASVRLDQTTTLPPVELNLVTYTTETIEVIETSPVIDNTQSAVVESVGEDYFDRLPVSRSYQGIIRTLPGVSGRIDYQNGGPSDGNPSVRGEGRYGNNYLLEGFSIRDPVEKTTGPDFPFEAMQELVVYTDGAPAEFGEFTGMLANMILKSGTNDYHGTLSYILDRHASAGQYEILGQPTDKRKFMSQTPVITLGGPVVQDKLWFYSVFDYMWGYRQIEGASVASRTLYNYMFMTKFTYNPFTDSSTLFNLIVQSQGSERENAGADATVAQEATVNPINDVFSLNANMKSVLSPFVVLEAKWNRSRDRYRSKPAGGDIYAPSFTDYYTGYVSGNSSYLYSTTRERDGFAVHLTRYVAEALGQHVLKGGYEFHNTANEDEFFYTGGQGTESDPAYEYLYLEEDGDHLLDPGEEYVRTAHFNVGPLAHKGSGHVFFVQDQWQPISSLVLNLGLRVQSETLLQNSNQQVIRQWVTAPRFGLAWDVTQDSTNLVTANAGRYYDVNGLGFADWADNRSSNHYVQCEWDPETRDYTANCFTQDPVGNPLAYGEDLVPYHLDKFTLGFTRSVAANITVSLKGIVSTTRELPEDVQKNPAEWVIVNPELKRRDFWAIELTSQRRFSDNWQVLGSVTYSRSKGTSPGSFEAGSAESTGGSGNEVGVFMDDIADPWLRVANAYWGYDFGGLGYDSFEAFNQTFPGNAAGWYGYLPYHSFVTIKVNGSYRLPWNTEVGLVYEFDSGHAWQRRGIQDLYGGHLTFPEGRGSRFMPPVHYLDLRLAQEFHLPRDLKILADLTVFNVFDLEQVVNYYENFNPPDDEGGSFGQVFFRQAPRAIRANVTFEF